MQAVKQNYQDELAKEIKKLAMRSRFQKQKSFLYKEIVMNYTGYLLLEPKYLK